MARINLPPLTRSLLAILVILTLVNDLVLARERTLLSWFTSTGHGSPLVSMVPGSAYRYPWTFASATFVEQNIFGLFFTSLTLLYGGRYLERAWGSTEFAKFMLMVCLVPNFLCFSLYVLFYGASKSQRALDTTISGGIAIQSSFLVAFKQLVPEHTVSVLRGIIRVRVKHFPAVFLLVNTISGLLLGTETALFLSWFAFLASWVYLRFYRASPILSTSTGGDVPTVVGDASDTFSFASFFPEPIHTPVAAVADQVYNLLVLVRICTPFSAEDIDVGNEQALARVEGGLPSLMTTRGSGRREEAERRRALALKALDQRLHAAVIRGGNHASSTSSSGVPESEHGVGESSSQRADASASVS